eukprot:TRINITY_DN23419_c0_g1_i1.p1 TRINITY_DN23419_c0_g1~~TRINITY_DN23419_c0_g1_i1.p1  ORF type:complete len:339 (+),score=41.82 TRINITY_DN23419_c0_g1_i1:37-1017(+)
MKRTHLALAGKRRKKLKAVDPSVVMRPIEWPDEVVSGGISHAPFAHIQPYTGYPEVPLGEGMKLVAWNVDGLGRLLKRNMNLVGQLAMREVPTVLCLQETHCNEENGLVEEMLRKYEGVHNFTEKEKAGGVSIYVKKGYKIEDVVTGMPGCKVYAPEGRIVTVVGEKEVIVGVSSPPAGRGLSKLESRIEEWEKPLLRFLCKLKEILPQKELFVLGSLSVAPTDYDIANPRLMANEPLCSQAERDAFTTLLTSLHLRDTFRVFQFRHNWYTQWDRTHAARERNVGARTDFVLSPSYSKAHTLIHSSILNAYHCSTHCPVACSFRYT